MKNIIIPRRGSNWVDAGAITMNGVTTDPTKGTITTDKVFWRYDGQDAIIRYHFCQGAAGANGSGEYLLSIPAAAGVADTNIVPASTNNMSTQSNLLQPSYIGHGSGGIAGSNNSIGACYLYSSTQFRVIFDTVAGGAGGGGFFGSAWYGLGSANVGFVFEIRVPIVGRSS